MKVGLFLGSFNPIHNGHIAIATYALDYVDQVWFVVAKQNPNKMRYSVSFEDRCAMVKQSLNCLPDISAKLNSCEVNLSGYTIDTLNWIEENEPDNEYYIICGDDTYNNIINWQCGEYILFKYKFIVFRRNDCEVPNNVIKLNILGFSEVSSTLIRNIIKTDINKLKLYVPQEVYNYIKENNLYVNSRKTKTT